MWVGQFSLKVRNMIIFIYLEIILEIFQSTEFIVCVILFSYVKKIKFLCLQIMYIFFQIIDIS